MEKINRMFVKELLTNPNKDHRITMAYKVIQEGKDTNIVQFGITFFRARTDNKYIVDAAEILCKKRFIDEDQYKSIRRCFAGKPIAPNRRQGRKIAMGRFDKAPITIEVPIEKGIENAILAHCYTNAPVQVPHVFRKVLKESYELYNGLNVHGATRD